MIEFPKTTRTLCIAFCALLGLTATCSSQTNRQLTRPITPWHSKTSAAQIMKQSLSLSDEQAQKLEPMLREQQDTVNALRQNTAMSRGERAAKLKQIQESADAKMKQILTPEQVEKWHRLTSKPQLAAPGPDALGTNRLNGSHQAPRWHSDPPPNRSPSTNANSSAGASHRK